MVGDSNKASSNELPNNTAKKKIWKEEGHQWNVFYAGLSIWRDTLALLTSTSMCCSLSPSALTNAVQALPGRDIAFNVDNLATERGGFQRALWRYVPGLRRGAR
jgi:phage terminase large subunit-like protein